MVEPGTLDPKEAGRAPGMVRAAGVTYSYGGGAPVLNGVDLEVGVGEIVALVGPKGSGKSTLLRILAGALAPSAGTLELAAHHTGGGRMMLGYAAAEGAHFESLSGRQNALFFARAAGLRRAEAEAAVTEYMDLLGLKGDATRPLAEYSFDARRRLLLVEALAHRPALTLLDQPFVGLDRRAREALIQVLRLLSAKRGTVVVASSELGLLPELVDRMLFMHEGRIVAGGRVAELLSSVGSTTRIEVHLERRPSGLEPRFRPGTRLVSEGDPMVLESDRGQAAVGEVCVALNAVGAVIRSVTVREADLAEAFRRVTGVAVDG